ncbi:MAG TPA: permease-like cell division protein FtsX [Rhodocyclaceae bacterium]|nr:permease-like cell division protein FtsX [Rhodocyclaceae bacterium]
MTPVWIHQSRDAALLALRRLVVAPVNTLLSVLAIGVALALPAGGQLLLGNAIQLARNSAPTPQISVFMQLDADKRAAHDVEVHLKDHPGVKAFRFIPREDTLARMRASEGLADVIDALPKNPFPDAFAIVPTDPRPSEMEQLAEELRHVPRVDQVELDSDWVRRLNALLRIGRSGVVLLGLLLSVGLVAITFNTIRLQIMTSRAEIEVSRLLGATDTFVRRPFEYFGIFLGLAGGIVALLIVAGTGWWFRQPVSELVRLYSIDFSLRPLSLFDSAVVLLSAAGLGWIGAGLSLRQHLTDE